jgi:enhancing lycopene biosynthesis protein 2
MSIMSQFGSKKIAVILSGCGFKDGAEITESVSALIALSEAKAEYKIFAPDITISAKNHQSGNSAISNTSGSTSGERNLLNEAARIARGEITDLKKLSPSDFDGLVMPGGYGAATHLCTFATEGAKCKVLPDVERVINEFHKQDKPIAAFCIAPAVVARVLGPKGVTLTIGNDVETAKEIEKTGAHHVVCAVDDYITDRETKVITSPAYMYDDATPAQVFTGIRRAVRELIEMA